jgi:glycosyltransferase involved in cell wall biosynthesis
VTYADRQTDFFQLSAGVMRLTLGVNKARRTALLRLPRLYLDRLKQLRHTIIDTAPEVVMAYGARLNVLTLLALLGSGHPVIATEHGDVSLSAGLLPSWLSRKGLWYRLRRFCYPLAFKVVSVSEAVKANFLWLHSDRAIVINNPFRLMIAPEACPLPAGLDAARSWLVSMGRLCHAKGFDLLLLAFAQVAVRHREWQLLILGDGDLRADLELSAHRLGLGDQVVFAGALNEPFSLLRRAQLFVMASRYEGFPMAHGEAMACGLPVIASDCPSRPRRLWQRSRPAGGVRELIRHDVDGWLVPPQDCAALARALDEFMSSPDKRRRLAGQAGQVVRRFGLEKILDQWERLFHQALSAGR